MKYAIGLGMVMVLCAAAWGDMVIDGNVGDWDAACIFNDPGSDNTGGVEMTRWGAKVEGGYLYWFCEISQDFTDFQGMAGSKAKKVFPALWIDADGSTETYLADGGDANCADGDKGEWSGNHRGIDLNLELGLIGNWVNESNTGPDGEGPDDSMYNYWGADDDVGNVEDKVTDGSWYISGNVLEARISLAELEAILLEMTDGVAIGDDLLLAVGVQGTNRGDVGYGYDVGTPRTIAVSAGVPEPATLSLLAIGCLAIRRRK
ncbi:MAG: PEP-CTERM sorting domain-containing protein [Phycisphaerae bacterium]|nr:PEP-CTERM sorting domain-containing protein [Phycisphaerae bacterium]